VFRGGVSVARPHHCNCRLLHAASAAMMSAVITLARPPEHPPRHRKLPSTTHSPPRSSHMYRSAVVSVLLVSACAFAQRGGEIQPNANLVTEGIPPIPAALAD